MITCRICSAKAAPNEDAIMLCPACMANPAAASDLIHEALVAAEQRYDELHTNAAETPELLRRLFAVDIAKLQAIGNPDAQAAYQRRRAATIAKGDQLSIILQAEDALERTKEWYLAAVAELDALADVQPS